MDDPQAPKAAPYLQNRELSWLAFNERVLDQGADETVPLLERLNFISIFWSNLQEFFMVRVGSLTDLALVKKHIIDSKSGMTPSEQLAAIYARCHGLYPAYEHTYETLRGLLQQVGVCHLRPADLNDEQRAFLRDHVDQNVLPFLSPQIINARHPFPHLENGALYVVVRLDEQAEAAGDGKGAQGAAGAKGKDKNKAAKGAKDAKDAEGAKSEKGKGGHADKDKGKSGKAGPAEKAAVKQAKAAKNLGAEGVTLGLVPMPRQCQRIIALPGDGLQFILLEHAIEMAAPEIFSMYKVKHTNVVCVTRNADLDATEGTDESDEEDYREHMKRILKKRARLAPVRLESERKLSSTVGPLLMKRLNLKEHQTFVTSVPLDMSYTWGVAARLPEKQRATLTNAPFAPQWPACARPAGAPSSSRWPSARCCSRTPTRAWTPFVQLLREAAHDPAVVSIKITLYRLAQPVASGGGAHRRRRGTARRSRRCSSCAPGSTRATTSSGRSASSRPAAT